MMMQSRTIKWCARVLAWLIFLSVSASIFSFSHQPAEQSSELSQSVLHEVLKKVMPGYEELPAEEQEALMQTYHSLIRKVAHFGIYTLWGLSLSVLLFLYERRIRTISLTVLCGGFLYALSDEFHQTFANGRAAQFSDVLIDTAGTVFGFLFFLFLGQIWKRFLKLSEIISKKP